MNYRNKQRLEDFLTAISIALVIIGFFVVLVVGGILGIDRNACIAEATVLELEYDWGFFSGCNVEVDGTFYPIDQYVRVVLDQ